MQRLNRRAPAVSGKRACAPSFCFGGRQAGFTLIELVMVMLVAAVLAAFAYARLSRTDFDAVGFADRAEAVVRYAQKVAVAQRRHVCVAISGNALTVTLQSAPGAFAACDAPVRDPSSGDPLVATAESGVTVAVAGGPASFVFDPLGRPGLAGQLAVTVSGGDVTRTFRVEPETGHVHG